MFIEEIREAEKLLTEVLNKYYKNEKIRKCIGEDDTKKLYSAKLMLSQANRDIENYHIITRYRSCCDD